jgi:hypothetical protein
MTNAAGPPLRLDNSKAASSVPALNIAEHRRPGTQSVLNVIGATDETGANPAVRLKGHPVKRPCGL